MASIWLSASSADAEAAFATVTRLAQAMGAEDGRSLDQRRSDIGIQLWQGGLTLTDLDDVATAVSARTGTVVAGSADGATTGTVVGAADPATGPATDAANGAATGAVESRADIAGDAEATNTCDADTTAEAVPADGAAGDPDGADTNATSAPCAGGVEPPGDNAPGGGPPTVVTARARPPGPAPAAVSEQALIDAVAAVLARRPQTHETVRKPLIQVVVGYDTLTGGSDRPAELLGHGPIDAGTARALAADGLWKRLVTDELSGALLDHGRTTYRPPPALADFVDARDQYCRFPTCTRRVRELDHHERFSGDGHTKDDNLNGYCRTHHLLKEHRDWHVLAHPDGRLTWITPTGRRYTSEPYDYRPFTDALPKLNDADRGDEEDRVPVVGSTTVDLDADPPAGDDDPPPF